MWLIRLVNSASDARACSTNLHRNGAPPFPRKATGEKKFYRTRKRFE